MYSPPGQGNSLSILGVGLLGNNSISLPGVLVGNLGLPNPVFLPPQPTPDNGVTEWNLSTTPLPEADLEGQAFWLKLLIYAGSTADLSVVK